MKLDELSRRLSTFTKGTPIVLGNGQAWHFPKPRMKYVPVFDADGKVEMRRGAGSVSPEIDPILDRVLEAETDGELAVAAVEMAYHALRMNYDLAPDEMKHLVYWVSGDEANLAMWRELVDFARADLFTREDDDSPKPSAVGSETTSSPTASTPTP